MTKKADRTPKSHQSDDSKASALAALQPRLAKLPKARVQNPMTDVQAAATFALDRAQKVKVKALRERFLGLPKGEFDAGNLDLLETAAQATLAAQLAYESASATAVPTKIPLDLAQRAVTQRERMLRLCDYYFEGDAKLGAEVRDIRSGHGYADLASDLQRLATLYTEQKSVVSQDKRLYNPGDAAAASAIAGQILAELGRGDGKGRRIAKAPDARDTLWRCFALLLGTYDEVAAAGRFLLRHEGGEALFPSLIAAGRQPRKRPARKPGTPSTDTPSSK